MEKSKRHIVIVDDEESMRGLLRDFFTAIGYQADCYPDAKSALAALRMDDSVSAVISDVRMDPVNGIEFLKTLKGEFPLLPVILFSGNGNPDERDFALQTGAARYFTKPFSLTELRRVVEQPVVSKTQRNKR